MSAPEASEFPHFKLIHYRTSNRPTTEKALQQRISILTIAAPWGHRPLTRCAAHRQTESRDRSKALTSRRGHALSTIPPHGAAYEPGAGGVGRRIEEAIELIEMELRHAAAYVNDNVIPQVRSESITALRTVADTLRNFADRLDGQAGQPKDPRV
jgi:hypothetical protein